VAVSKERIYRALRTGKGHQPGLILPVDKQKVDNLFTPGDENGSAYFTDFNAVTKSGLYASLGPSPANAPVADTHFLIHVQNTNAVAGYCVQFAIPKTISGAPQVFIRHQQLGAWGNWKILYQDSGWNVPTYNTNWSSWNGPGGGETIGGFRFYNGVVQLKGLVKKAVALTVGDVIFTLPVGYRPAQEWIFSAASFGGYTELRVGVSGAVYIQAGGNPTWTSLAGVEFDPNTV